MTYCQLKILKTDLKQCWMMLLVSPLGFRLLSRLSDRCYNDTLVRYLTITLRTINGFGAIIKLPKM